MSNRREFLRNVASATAGMVIGSRAFADAALGASQAAPPARRRVSIDGRRVTVIDIHAHTFVPELTSRTCSIDGKASRIMWASVTSSSVGAP